MSVSYYTPEGFQNLKDLFCGFGLNVEEVNGHSIHDLCHIFLNLSNNGPTIIIAKTIKGFGLPKMENNPEWHHKFPSKNELKQMTDALK